MRDLSWVKRGLVGAWCPSVSGWGGYLLKDLSYNNNNLLLNNMNPDTDYIVNNGLALDFDGSGNFIECFTEDPTVYTISVWVFIHSLRNAPIIFRNNGSEGTYSHEIRIILSAGSYRFSHYTYDGSIKQVTSFSTITTGVWYHVAATAQNDGLVKLYFNGKPEGTPVTVGTLWVSGDRYWIARQHGGFSYFHGQLDDIRIYNWELSEDKIAQLSSHRGFGLRPQRQRKYFLPLTSSYVPQFMSSSSHLIFPCGV